MSIFRFSKKSASTAVALPAENPFAFEHLAPVSDAEQVETYLKSLKWALSNPEVKNIAVTGPYGSGKSSMLKTFQEKFPEFVYLNISLASFQEEKTGDDKVPEEATSKNQAHRMIELSILQQMFYQVSDDKIPDSRFKRINHLTDKQLHRITRTALAGMIGIVLLLFPSFLEQISDWKVWLTTHRWVTMLFGIILAAPALIWWMKFLVRFFNNSGFKKLNISSGEIEINPKSETSILNKYFDEIVYFFQVNTYNVVILEDLDRFNDPEIFTKLREVNILLNNSSQLGRHIAFIYAIKDDMFPDDKTRTKFFEFILPIIPVVNWFNSLEIFTRKMNNPRLGLKVNEGFLSDIMLYIDDMRVLKNIFNEYMIYRENLKGNLRPEKLLAIVIYKNIYPDDFAALHRNDGLVFKIFSKKKTLTLQALKDKQEQKQKTLSAINRAEQSQFKTLEELRAVYMLRFTEQYPTLYSIEVNGAYRHPAELLTDELFDNFRKLTSVNYRYYRINYTGEYSSLVKLNFADLEKKIDPEQTYEQRANDVRNRQERLVKRHKEDVEKIDAEIQEIQSLNIKDLLERNTDLVKELPSEFTQHRLLLFLIREGYIDEMYPSYISYFYEGNLTRNDMDFLISIKDQQPLPLDFPLSKVAGVVKKLNEQELGRDAVLNKHFVQFLFEEKRIYKLAYSVVCKKISNNSELAFAFLDNFLSTEVCQQLLFKDIQDWWPTYWTDFGRRPTITEAQKTHYLSMIVKYGNIDKLISSEHTVELKTFIEQKNNFLQVVDPVIYSDRIKRVISHLKIKFKEVELSDKTALLFDFIYTNHYYELNPEMVRIILAQKTTISDEDRIERANYTTVQSSGCAALIEYVAIDIEDYIDNVLLALPDNNHESVESVISLLNNEAVSMERKEHILEKQEIVIDDLSKILGKEVWYYVLINDRMTPTWHNVGLYYENAEDLDEDLINWLNINGNTAGLAAHKFKPDDKFDEKIVLKITRALLTNNEIDDKYYKDVLNGIWYWKFPELDISTLSDHKIQLLIKLDKLAVSTANYAALKGKYKDYTALLARDVDEFLKSPQDYALVEKEYLALFEQPVIDNTKRRKLIDHLATTGTIENMQLANVIIKLLINEPKQALNISFVNALFSKGIFSYDKAKLFAMYMHDIDKTDLRVVLQSIKGDITDLAGRGRPKLANNDLNLKIVQFLYKIDFISSFSVNSEKQTIRVNTKRS